MALTKVAQAEYDRLVSQYHYGHDEAESEAKAYAKAIADAKRKPEAKKKSDA